MTTEYDIKAETNAVDASKKRTTITCEQWWEMAQQWAYTRISWKIPGDNRARLIDDHTQRAKMIAGIYARFYLEIERRGNPNKKGRYYWMGLGAFASKTMFYVFSDARASLNVKIPFAQKVKPLDATHILAKGNLWLFMDIAPTHLNYSHATEDGTPPDSFNKCIEKRDTRTFKQPKVVSAMSRMPGSAEVLPKVDFLKLSGYIKTGFENVRVFENTKNQIDKRKAQWNQLMAIAQHEQEIILQRVCWNDPVLRNAMDDSRTFSWFAPKLKLIFSHKEDVDNTDDNTFRSPMPKGTTVENLRSRMEWITKAAEKYHKLMLPKDKGGKLEYMEGELRTIAGWWTNIGNLIPNIPVETPGSAQNPYPGSAAR